MSESMDGREVFVSSCDISPYSSWKKTTNIQIQIQIHFKTLLTLLKGIFLINLHQDMNNNTLEIYKVILILTIRTIILVKDNND